MLQGNRLSECRKFRTGDTVAEANAQNRVPLSVFQFGHPTASVEIRERPFPFFTDCQVVWTEGNTGMKHIVFVAMVFVGVGISAKPSARCLRRAPTISCYSNIEDTSRKRGCERLINGKRCEGSFYAYYGGYTAYCYNCYQIVKAEEERRSAPEGQRKNQMKDGGLAICQAYYDDASKCTLYAIPKSRYCTFHQNFNSKNPPHRVESRLPETDSEHVNATSNKMAYLVECIGKYVDRSGGRTPGKLSDLRAVLHVHPTPPMKDSWGCEFQYVTDRTDYSIVSAGADGRFDTDDDLHVLCQKGMGLKFVMPNIMYPGTECHSVECPEICLLHRWSFNGDLLDSEDKREAKYCGSAPLAWSDDGHMVSLCGGSYGTSGLDLGSGVVPVDVNAFTIEIWARQRTVQWWSRIFEVGVSYNDMLNMCWTGGDSINQDAVQVYKGFPRLAYVADDSLAPYTLGVEFHISLVVKSRADGFTHFRYARRELGTGKILSEGEGDSSFPWTIKELPCEHFYLGHHHKHPNRTSDASADYDEVRIWRGALSDAQLSESARSGPDALPKF